MVSLALALALLSLFLGITSKTYLSYIRGNTPIPSDVLVKMARLFDCTTDYLLGLQTDNAS